MTTDDFQNRFLFNLFFYYFRRTKYYVKFSPTSPVKEYFLPLCLILLFLIFFQNESAAFKHVKKIGVSTTEVTKRAALGDLQNRGVVRTIAAKDAAQKE